MSYRSWCHWWHFAVLVFEYGSIAVVFTGSFRKIGPSVAKDSSVRSYEGCVI